MKKISLSLSGHQTSISLEKEFIFILKKIAKKENKSVASIVTEIDISRTQNLSSAVRIWILGYIMKNKID